MSDLNVIKRLQQKLKTNLQELDKINWEDRGYTLNKKGQVIGLGLCDCQIKNLKAIQPFLQDFENLTELRLQYNGLDQIAELRNLQGLVTLDLGRNKLGEDLSPIEILVNLTSLNLFDNQISDISTLSSLNKLKELSLNNNKISDISPLSKLKKLEKLNLNNNLVEDISPLQKIIKLSRLSLAENQFTDISSLKDLKNLEDLDLRNNPIEELEPWITDNKMNIEWEAYSLLETEGIHFYNNPLKIPPPEIIRQGKGAIKNYFDQLEEQDEDYLFEAKMLIVGEPGAGKTTMSWKIQDGNCKLPEEKDTTRGIEVKQWYFPMDPKDFTSFKHPDKLKNNKFRLNIWDFGGQEIYKATHRFFLSQRALYTLVSDSRNEDTDFNYWLHIIEMFGGSSPLLIVLNEKHQRKQNLDVSAMKSRFTNISEVIDVDFADNDTSRLNKLKKAIKYHISQLPHIGGYVPSNWTGIRKTLEKDLRKTITINEYLKICSDNGITKTKDTMVLSQYFHDIGVFLHFQDDDLLKKTIFLDPNWSTNAVYKILNHEMLNKNHGRINKKDAETIWHEGEYDYLREDLLRLMKKFFLIYEIENSGNYIVPERLPQAQPKYSWKEEDNLFLGYEYDLFMPKGIISQFIVTMNQYIGNHDFVWVRGVVLNRENSTAEIIESYDARKIFIRVSGTNKRDLMTIITEKIDLINAQFDNTKVDKMIPCNCEKCKADDQPYFFEYDKLRHRLNNKIQTIDCEVSFKKIDINSLMDEVVNQNLQSIDENNSTQKTKVTSEVGVKRNRVFISYAHGDDKKWIKIVQTHLKALESEGMQLNLWDDTHIKPGMRWRDEIEKGLTTTKVAILLMSPEFLASEFISKNELPPLLDAAEKDGAIILPLIVKPCRYSSHQIFSVFQSVNRPRKEPLSMLSENLIDEILVRLTNRVAEIMNEIEED